ncbi:hypothetical protein [Prauserella cavernicola]|uniref:Uncharacterized protein n=1 Tax=Prauserella cavernicola TaxID=2800127 RepID=A0A934QUH6_9PSEU|nr:hypothetical protein [Prauserella cavernicola]MBK1788482.1 hypothetical protein [Prauserella cavernicola]
MTGGAELDQAATGAAMAELRAAGEAFVSGWAEADASIATLAGTLGGGPVGQAFLSTYRPGAEAVSSSAAEGSALPGQYADIGRRCVADYLGADAAGAVALETAGGDGTS